MGKSIAASQDVLFSTSALFAAAKYPAPAIPAGQNVVISVKAPGLVRKQPENIIYCEISGQYNYDNACALVCVRARPGWPNPAGGMSRGPMTVFLAPENQSLPEAPPYDCLVTLPNLPMNTVGKVHSEIKVTKPKPVGGMPPIPVTKDVVSAGTNAPPIEDTPMPPVVEQPPPPPGPFHVSHC